MQKKQTTPKKKKIWIQCTNCTNLKKIIEHPIEIEKILFQGRENKEMMRLGRRPTIISPTSHIRSYNFRPFLALILTGCALSIIGGFINTICLVGYFEMSISAATGSTSRMVVNLAKGNLDIALHFSLLILSFLLGSFTSAALVGGSSFRIQRSYGLVLLLESFALIFGYLFEKTTFTLIGSAKALQLGAYLISLACGLQNGMCTTFSGAVIRTTHVTGILTDIGLILGQAIFYPRTRKHLWKLKVLLPLFGGFCLGGILGYFAYQFFNIQAILIPCAIVGISGLGHICYCRIFLRYRTRQVSEKHWKRNRISVPTVEDRKDQQNEIAKPDPTDLQAVSIQNPPTEPLAS